MDILIYVTVYHSDLKSEWDSSMLVGFFSSMDHKYYVDLPNDDRKLIETSERIKVIAWTLLPRCPKYVRDWI